MIDFINLDEGQDLCTELYKTSMDKGTNIVTSLNGVIENLKDHWHGDDAMVHINNLISINDKLANFVNKAVSDVGNANNSAVSAQEVRNANGANGNVGARLDDKVTIDYSKPAMVEGTKEYKCDEGARSDYDTLSKLSSEFQEFTKKVSQEENAIMDNWREGAERKTTKENFDDFIEFSDSNKKQIDEALEALKTAIDNINIIA